MSFSYFNKLNYSLANEDTSFEYAMLPVQLGHIVSIAGSGARILPLLARQPKKLTCADLSAEQLYLTEMRIEACRQLEYEEYIKLLGYESVTAEERRDLFNKLELSKSAFDYLMNFFNSIKFESLLYEGKWERTFATLAKMNSIITGEAGRSIFECRTLEDQRSYYQKEFPRLRFKLVLFLLGNASVFNALLYKGHFVDKNIQWSHRSFYQRSFEHLFQTSLLRENFFMQILFFGRIEYSDAWLLEANPKIFLEAKTSLKDCVVEYRQGNILETVQNLNDSVDFLGLSDVPSYFSDDTEKNFMQTIRPKISSDGLVAIRNYLRIPFRPDLRGYENVSPNFENLARLEKTGMYFIDIYKKLG